MVGSPQTVGIAIVGSGFAAKFHAENYVSGPGPLARLIGVYSRRHGAAREFAGRHGFDKAYETLDALLADPEVDLVDICVPTRFHEEFVVQALNAHKHVAVEKPLTGCFNPPGRDGHTIQDCLRQALASADRMLLAERESGKRICYDENWVYSPPIQKACRLLASAETPILRIVGEESHSGTHSPYAMRWDTAGGGSLIKCGCHPVGGALYLKAEEGRRRFGRPIRPVWVVGTVANLTHSAAFQSEGNHYIRTGWTDCEDWGSLTMGFEDGTVAQVTGADTAVGGINNTMTVYAGRAALQLNFSPNNTVVAYSADQEAFANEYIREKVETTAGWQFTNPDEDWINGFPHEMREHCEVGATGRQPLSDSALARDVLEVCYAAYVSAHTGRRVDLQLA